MFLGSCTGALTREEVRGLGRWIGRKGGGERGEGAIVLGLGVTIEQFQTSFPDTGKDHVLILTLKDCLIPTYL
jgi:hypothetical protein